MPIHIRRTTEGSHEVLGELAGDNWDLSSQIGILQSWVEANAPDLPKGEYVADLGFCWRRDAMGGGADLPPDFLMMMGQAGISLFLSEYPGFSTGEEDSEAV